MAESKRGGIVGNELIKLPTSDEQGTSQLVATLTDKCGIICVIGKKKRI